MPAAFFRSLILGPPGSGKGTISSRIVRDFKLAYLASGDLLRSQMMKSSAEGVEIKKYIKKGILVPDYLVSSLILKELEEIIDSDWLLDGFPRTVSQAEILLQRVQITCAINLNIPDEVIIDRLKGRWLHSPSGRTYHDEFNPPKIKGKDDVTGEDLIQREDDKLETIQVRLESYKTQTQPVIDYYRNKNLLLEFKGRESNEIWPRIRMQLEPIIFRIRNSS